MVYMVYHIQLEYLEPHTRPRSSLSRTETRPLQSHHKEGTGRMVEEWDLAANKATKRIMVRQCVRDIAQTLEEAGKEGSDNVTRRVYVKGKAGVGKVSLSGRKFEVSGSCTFCSYISLISISSIFSP